MESVESNEIVFRSKDKEFVAHETSFVNARSLTPQPESNSEIPERLLHVPAKLRHTEENPTEAAQRRKARRAVVSSPLINENDDNHKVKNVAESVNYREAGLKKLKSTSWESLARWSKENDFLFTIIQDEANWLSRLFPDDPIYADKFFDMLQDGVLLCKLARLCQQYAEDLAEKNNKRIPSFTTFIHPRSRCQGKLGKFLSRENVELFLKWCRHHRIPEPLLFESNDVVDKTEQDGLRDNAREIVLCLMEVARLGVKFGVEPPTLLLLEQEIELEEQQDSSLDGSISPVSVDSGFDTTDLFQYNNTRERANSKPDREKHDSTGEGSPSHGAKYKRNVYLDSREKQKSLDSTRQVRARTNIRLGARQKSLDSAQSMREKSEEDISSQETTEFSRYLTSSRFNKDLDEGSRFVGVLYPHDGGERNFLSSKQTKLVQYEVYNDDVNTSLDENTDQQKMTLNLKDESDHRTRSSSDGRLDFTSKSFQEQENHNAINDFDTVDSSYQRYRTERTDSDASGGENGLTGREKYRRRKTSATTKQNNDGGGQPTERQRRKSSGYIKTELHRKVTSILESYNIQTTQRLKEGKYIILGRIMFVRLLNNHCIVRIGGGWDTLEHYLMTHVSKVAPDSFESEATGSPASVRQGRKKSGNLLRHRKNAFITASTPNLLHIDNSPDRSVRNTPSRTRSPSPNRSKDPYEQEKALRRHDDRKISQAILKVQADVVGGCLKKATSLDWTHLKDREFTLKKYSSITPIAKSKLKLIKKMADIDIETVNQNKSLNDSTNQNESLNDSTNNNGELPQVTHEPPTPTVDEVANPLDEKTKNTSDKKAKEIKKATKTTSSTTKQTKTTTTTTKTKTTKPSSTGLRTTNKTTETKVNGTVKATSNTSKTTPTMKSKTTAASSSRVPSKTTTTRTAPKSAPPKSAPPSTSKPLVKKTDVTKSTGRPASTSSVSKTTSKKPLDTKKADTIKTPKSNSTTSKTTKSSPVDTTGKVNKTTTTKTSTAASKSTLSAKSTATARTSVSQKPTKTGSVGSTKSATSVSKTTAAKTIAAKTTAAKTTATKTTATKPSSANKTSVKPTTTKPAAKTSSTLTKTKPASTKPTRVGSASPPKKTTSKPTAKVSPTKKPVASKQAKTDEKVTSTVFETKTAEITEVEKVIVVPTAEIIDDEGKKEETRVETQTVESIDQTVGDADKKLTEDSSPGTCNDTNLPSDAALPTEVDNKSHSPEPAEDSPSVLETTEDTIPQNQNEAPDESTQKEKNDETITDTMGEQNEQEIEQTSKQPIGSDSETNGKTNSETTEKTEARDEADEENEGKEEASNIEATEREEMVPVVEEDAKETVETFEESVPSSEEIVEENTPEKEEDAHLDASHLAARDFDLYCVTPLDRAQYDSDYEHTPLSPAGSPIKKPIPSELDLLPSENAVETEELFNDDSTPLSDVATCNTERPSSQVLSPSEENALCEQDGEGRTGRLGYADETALILDAATQQNMDEVVTETRNETEEGEALATSDLPGDIVSEGSNTDDSHEIAVEDKNVSEDAVIDETVTGNNEEALQDKEGATEKDSNLITDNVLSDNAETEDGEGVISAEGDGIENEPESVMDNAMNEETANKHDGDEIQDERIANEIDNNSTAEKVEAEETANENDKDTICEEATVAEKDSDSVADKTETEENAGKYGEDAIQDEEAATEKDSESVTDKVETEESVNEDNGDTIPDEEVATEKDSDSATDKVETEESVNEDDGEAIPDEGVATEKDSDSATDKVETEESVNGDDGDAIPGEGVETEKDSDSATDKAETEESVNEDDGDAIPDEGAATEKDSESATDEVQTEESVNNDGGDTMHDEDVIDKDSVSVREDEPSVKVDEAENVVADVEEKREEKENAEPEVENTNDDIPADADNEKNQGDNDNEKIHGDAPAFEDDVTADDNKIAEEEGKVNKCEEVNTGEEVLPLEEEDVEHGEEREDSQGKTEIDELVLNDQEITPVEKMPDALMEAWSAETEDAEVSSQHDSAEIEQNEETEEKTENKFNTEVEENTILFEKRILLTEESMEVHCGSTSVSPGEGRLSTHDFEAEDTIEEESVEKVKDEDVFDQREDSKTNDEADDKLEDNTNDALQDHDDDGENTQSEENSEVKIEEDTAAEEIEDPTNEEENKNNGDDDDDDEGNMASDVSTTEIQTTVVVEHSSTVVSTSVESGKILMGEYAGEEENDEESEDSEEADSPNHHVMLRQSSSHTVNHTIYTTERIETHEGELIDNDENLHEKSIDGLVESLDSTEKLQPDEVIFNKFVSDEKESGELTIKSSIGEVDNNQNQCFDDLESY